MTNLVPGSIGALVGAALFIWVGSMLRPPAPDFSKIISSGHDNVYVKFGPCTPGYEARPGSTSGQSNSSPSTYGFHPGEHAPNTARWGDLTEEERANLDKCGTFKCEDKS